MRHTRSLLLFIAAVLLLSACGTATTPVATDPTPTTPQEGPTMTTQPTPSAYPKIGNAPDYSWIAGRVTVTKIQGGCIYIITNQAAIDAAIATPNPSNTITGPIVGTAVRSDTSPPLRDMTPDTSPQPTQPPGVRFVVSGPGWQEAQTKDGDYVLLFGHLAGSDEPREMCPGGTQYVVDKMLVNP